MIFCTVIIFVLWSVQQRLFSVTFLKILFLSTPIGSTFNARLFEVVEAFVMKAWIRTVVEISVGSSPIWLQINFSLHSLIKASLFSFNSCTYNKQIHYSIFMLYIRISYIPYQTDTKIFVTKLTFVECLSFLHSSNSVAMNQTSFVNPISILK